MKNLELSATFNSSKTFTLLENKYVLSTKKVDTTEEKWKKKVFVQDYKRVMNFLWFTTCKAEKQCSTRLNISFYFLENSHIISIYLLQAFLQKWKTLRVEVSVKPFFQSSLALDMIPNFEKPFMNFKRTKTNGIAD